MGNGSNVLPKCWLAMGSILLYLLIAFATCSSVEGENIETIIIGLANCGKTFLLRPLEDIFQTFSNPANDKYGWVGTEKAEVILLNDFRWASDLIKWNDFLLLLEGHKVHLPDPKYHFSSDLSIEKDTPIFATSKEAIKYIGKYNVLMNEKMR